MSNLYEDYKKRVQYKGKNKREYVKTKVKESIESLINDSQYGFTIEVNNEPHEVAISVRVAPCCDFLLLPFRHPPFLQEFRGPYPRFWCRRAPHNHRQDPAQCVRPY